MTQKSVPLCVLLSAVTFGIYFLYWFYVIAKEVISELKYQDIDKAEFNVLFLIITFGFYFFWWNYKMSNYLATIEQKNKIQPDFWAPIFSMWFSLILHQSRINRIASAKGKRKTTTQRTTAPTQKSQATRQRTGR